MKIKWIFFDIGSTLVNEDDSHRLRFEKALADIEKAGVRDMTFEKYADIMYEGAAKGHKSPFYYAMKRLGVNAKYHYSTDGETVYPESAGLLETLKKSYKIGIIANQPAGLEARIEAYGLLKYIDAVFGSDDVGYSKPDPSFYTYAMESVGCSPDEAVMIGDRPDNDIKPAKAAGMKTVRILSGYFKTAPAKKANETADITVNSLSEIPDAISRLD